MKCRVSLRGIALACLALTALSSCSGETAVEPPKAPPTAADPVSESSKTADAQDQVKIKGADDKTVLEITFKGSDDAKLEFADQVLRAKNKDGDKRKYELEGGSIVAEVKDGDEGFKLRTPDGKLLWKVKIDRLKIKISDNEENKNPYEIKFKDDGAKIERNDTEIAEVKFHKDSQKVKIKVKEAEKYSVNTERYSTAYGLAAVDAIPERDRAILIAELALRGK